MEVQSMSLKGLLSKIRKVEIKKEPTEVKVKEVKKTKELAEGLKKHSEIVNKYLKKAGLIQDIDIDGNFLLIKQYDEDWTAEKVGIRLVGDHYVAINIYDRKMQDEVYKEIAKPIEESGDDVIFILRDQDDRSLGGIIIYDTGEKKQ